MQLDIRGHSLDNTTLHDMHHVLECCILPSSLSMMPEAEDVQGHQLNFDSLYDTAS